MERGAGQRKTEKWIKSFRNFTDQSILVMHYREGSPPSMRLLK